MNLVVAVSLQAFLLLHGKLKGRLLNLLLGLILLLLHDRILGHWLLNFWCFYFELRESLDTTEV